MPDEPLTVYGASEVARWFLVGKATVSMWLNRYTDYPAPAVVMVTQARQVYGWTADQRDAWADWIRSKQPHSAAVSAEEERAQLLRRVAALEEQIRERKG